MINLEPKTIFVSNTLWQCLYRCIWRQRNTHNNTVLWSCFRLSPETENICIQGCGGDQIQAKGKLTTENFSSWQKIEDEKFVSHSTRTFHGVLAKEDQQINWPHAWMTHFKSHWKTGLPTSQQTHFLPISYHTPLHTKLAVQSCRNDFTVRKCKSVSNWCSWHRHTRLKIHNFTSKSKMVCTDFLSATHNYNCAANGEK